MKKVIGLENLDCANCAAKLERAINKIDKVDSASVNFMAMKMVLECAEEDYADVAEKIKAAAARVEPDCVFKGL